MAKAKPKGKAPAKGKSAGKGNMKYTVLAIGLAAVPFILPTMTFLFFAMAPTLVAAISDRGPNRFTWACVGGCNVAGAAPYLFTLWEVDHSISHTIEMLTDVLTMMIIYGAAASGWILYMAVPPISAAFMSIMSQRRVATLRAIQRKLVDEWGTDIIEEGKAEANQNS